MREVGSVLRDMYPTIRLIALSLLKYPVPVGIPSKNKLLVPFPPGILRFGAGHPRGCRLLSRRLALKEGVRAGACPP